MIVSDRQRQRYLVSLGIHEVTLTGGLGPHVETSGQYPMCLMFLLLVPALSRPCLRRSTP